MRPSLFNNGRILASVADKPQTHASAAFDESDLLWPTLPAFQKRGLLKIKQTPFQFFALKQQLFEQWRPCRIGTAIRGLDLAFVTASHVNRVKLSTCTAWLTEEHQHTTIW